MMRRTNMTISEEIESVKFKYMKGDTSVRVESNETEREVFDDEGSGKDELRNVGSENPVCDHS